MMIPSASYYRAASTSQVPPDLSRRGNMTEQELNSLARDMLKVFRKEQKKRTIGTYTGCYCNGCVECMREVLTTLTKQGHMLSEEQAKVRITKQCPSNCEHLVCQYGYADHLGDVLWWDCSLGRNPHRCKLAATEQKKV